MTGLERYVNIKHVLNECPECHTREWYRLRFVYPDEGNMVCIPCKKKLEYLAEIAFEEAR